MSKTKHLTDEQIEAKAKELTEQHKCTVYPLVFLTGTEEDSEQIIGYMKEPKRAVKMVAMDKAMSRPSFAGQDLLQACLIKEESDNRILSEKSEHDSIFLGACRAALEKVQISMEQLKKT